MTYSITNVGPNSFELGVNGTHPINFTDLAIQLGHIWDTHNQKPQVESFSLTKVGPHSFELGGHGTIKTTFTKTPTQEGHIWDIYSFNGKYSAKTLADLFSFNILKDSEVIEEVIKKWEGQSGQTVVVIDIKDSKGGYANLTEIQKAENEVIAFFKAEKCNPNMSKSAKKVYTLLKGKIHFVVCEGSLKHTLLAKVPKEISSNSTAFCIYTEYFMNGWKLGWNIDGISSEDFIKPVVDGDPSLQPKNKSTVYYPWQYYGMYNENSPYSNSINKFYKLCGEGFNKVSNIFFSITVGNISNALLSC